MNGKIWKVIITKIFWVFKRVINWIKFHIYEMFYAIILIVLSKYILINWNKCIAMKFFEKFDGNNILFLVWIVLIISLLYDVEAKGWKFRRKGIEDTRKQIENVEFNFQKIG